MASSDIEIKIVYCDRIDMEDMAGNIAEIPYSAPSTKSYQEILDEMVKTFSLHMESQFDLTPGTVICTLVEVFAGQLATMQFQMNELYAAMQIQKTKGWAPVQKSYPYPDGTSSLTRPRDGQVFEIDRGQKIDKYMWDGMKENWEWIGAQICNESTEFKLLDLMIKNPELTKCECGSEATGSPRHSSWCKKYNPDV